MLKEETKQPPDSEEVPENLPCIFGKEICQQCQVRKDIAEHKISGISKWVKPSDKILDGADELVHMFTDAMSMQYGILSSFCDVCPFLGIYIHKNT